jgi:hypothetical protein
MTHQSKQAEKVDVMGFGGGFIFWGIIYAVVSLILLFPTRGYSDMPLLFWLSIAGVCTGIGMVLVGMGIRRKWRYILLAAVPLYLLGLLQFPVGTAIFGWALRPLWFSRHHFFPFDKNETMA